MMNIQALYPATFDGTAENYTAFMRSILIKSSYDSVLKKMTGYKGMYLYQQSKECWTVKFDHFSGIFGVLFTGIHEGFGKFNLYYFPSPDESIVDKFSLSEAITTHDKAYLEKVREFVMHAELFRQFYIATLSLHVNIQTQTLMLLYKSKIRERVYAKEGVLDPMSDVESYVIEPYGLDKDLPSFRLLLPMMNFLNTAITRMSFCSPSYFKLFKAQQASVAYDRVGNFSDIHDSTSAQIFIALGYGEGDFETLSEEALKGQKAELVHETMSLNCFLQKAPWYDVSDEIRHIPSHNTLYDKPKLIVVTGFLGSGKTNFLQHYIEYETEKNHFVGIIQNEIGKTGLDGKLVDYDYSLVEIDEGCVCCSLAGQLRMGVATLMKNIVPDTILLETTGVANPFNLLSELHELEDLVDLEAIITVVDGPNALYLANEYRIFNDQIRSADLILLNKTDLMSVSEITQVEKFLHENNRCAKVMHTVQCDIHPNTLSQSLNACTAHISSLIAEEDGVKYTHVNDRISSRKLSLVKALNKEKFEAYLKALPQTIFRLKGIVCFENEPCLFVVQYVHGEYEFVAQPNEKKYETFLVYIGKDLDQYYLPSPY